MHSDPGVHSREGVSTGVFFLIGMDCDRDYEEGLERRATFWASLPTKFFDDASGDVEHCHSVSASCDYGMTDHEMKFEHSSLLIPLPICFCELP